MLADPARLTVITGMAGVGKTTLAVHAAHLMADRFPDGQLYIELRGFDRSGVALRQEDAVRQLPAGLGIPPERIPAGAEAQVGLYRSVLAGRQALIVLDNAGSAEQVRPLLPGGSGCGVLVTSRDQMRSLIATEGARLIGLTPLSPLEAREALTRRLGGGPCRRGYPRRRTTDRAVCGSPPRPVGRGRTRGRLRRLSALVAGHGAERFRQQAQRAGRPRFRGGRQGIPVAFLSGALPQCRPSAAAVLPAAGPPDQQGGDGQSGRHQHAGGGGWPGRARAWPSDDQARAGLLRQPRPGPGLRRRAHAQPASAAAAARAAISAD